MAERKLTPFPTNSGTGATFAVGNSWSYDSRYSGYRPAMHILVDVTKSPFNIPSLDSD
jgi:hypothetical protein